MRFQHLLYVVSLGFCLISVSACTSFQSERGEKRPTGREVAEEAGEATDAADRDDLVLYSTSIEDEEQELDEPADEGPVEEGPADDEPAPADEAEEADEADDETGKADEAEETIDEPNGEPAEDPAQDRDQQDRDQQDRDQQD